MANPIQIGQTLAIGGQPTLTGFIVSQARGGMDINQEDIEKANGQLSTRIIFRTESKLSLEVMAHGGLTPTAFTAGTLCADATYSGWFVDSSVPTYTKGATKWAIDMTNIGLTVCVPS